MSLRLRLNDGVEINIDDSDGDMELVACAEIDELRRKADLWDAKSRVAEYRAKAMLDDGRVSVSKARLRHLEAQAKKLAAVTPYLDEMRTRLRQFVMEEWYRRACVAMGKEHT